MTDNLDDLKANKETIRTSDVTASGSHFLKDFAVCPAKGARQHFYSHPNILDDPQYTVGLTGVYTPVQLLVGSAIHDGIEQWYRSRIRDGEDTGEADLDSAIAAVEMGWANRSRELHPDEDTTTLVSATRVMIQRYHDHFGQKGPLQEWPATKVVCDDTGEPWIEKHFEIDLGGGFTYTARIDLVVNHNGFLATMDHKSSKASFVRQLLTQAELEAQFTGQLLCLREHAPQLAITGILLNVLVKDRAKGPPFDRALLPRSRTNLDLYKLHTRDLFERISGWHEHYKTLLASGMDSDKAFNIAWPMDGLRHGGCYQYYRKCTFWDLCRSPDIAGQLIASSMRPKKRVINEVTQEEV